MTDEAFYTLLGLVWAVGGGMLAFAERVIKSRANSAKERRRKALAEVENLTRALLTAKHVSSLLSIKERAVELSQNYREVPETQRLVAQIDTALGHERRPQTRLYSKTPFDWFFDLATIVVAIPLYWLFAYRSGRFVMTLLVCSGVTYYIVRHLR